MNGKEYFVFNDTLSDFGGSAELIRRMCHWLRQNDYNVAVIADGAKNVELKNELESIGVNTLIMSDRNTKCLIGFLSSISGNRIKIISFVLDHFLRLEIAKKKGELEFTNLLYVIHPAAFTKGELYRNKILKNLAKRIYLDIYVCLNNNGSIVMETSEYLRKTVEHLGVLNGKEPAIRGIPFGYNPVDDIESMIRNGYESNVIMTTSRAEFPLKGYLMGLIDDFISLKDKFHEYQLLIVSDGEDYDALKRKIDDANDIIGGGISLHHWMKYDDLLKQVERCKIFIGHGTTVAEAASRYKPALVTLENRYDCRINGLFSEYGELIGTVEGNKPTRDDLENILQMEYDEYRLLCYQSFQTLQEKHDTDRVMKWFSDYAVNKKECIIPAHILLWQRIIDFKNKLIYG